MVVTCRNRKIKFEIEKKKFYSTLQVISWILTVLDIVMNIKQRWYMRITSPKYTPLFGLVGGLIQETWRRKDTYSFNIYMIINKRILRSPFTILYAIVD